MKIEFQFSDHYILRASCSLEEEKAVFLFCKVSNTTPDQYFKSIFESAVDVAVKSVDIAGGVDVVEKLIEQEVIEK